jgi:hypothetical protein
MHIKAEGDQSRIEYRAEMEPDSFIPPLIGPFLLKRKIRKELRATALIIETLALRSPKAEYWVD